MVGLVPISWDRVLSIRNGCSAGSRSVSVVERSTLIPELARGWRTPQHPLRRNKEVSWFRTSLQRHVQSCGRASFQKAGSPRHLAYTRGMAEVAWKADLCIERSQVGESG